MNCKQCGNDLSRDDVWMSVRIYHRSEMKAYPFCDFPCIKNWVNKK